MTASKTAIEKRPRQVGYHLTLSDRLLLPAVLGSMAVSLRRLRQGRVDRPS